MPVAVRHPRRDDFITAKIAEGAALTHVTLRRNPSNELSLWNAIKDAEQAQEAAFQEAGQVDGATPGWARRLQADITGLRTEVTELRTLTTAVERSLARLDARFQQHAAVTFNRHIRVATPANPWRAIVFADGTEPAQQNLPPLNVRDDVDALSVAQLNAYEAGYGLPITPETRGNAAQQHGIERLVAFIGGC